MHYLNTVSSSFGSVFIPAGIEASQGILLALYRKDVNDPQFAEAADVKAFRAFIAKYLPQGDLKDDVHNYGYSVAHTLLEVLKKAGDDLTRANIMKQASSIKAFEAPLLMPGIKINTSSTDFYPIQAVQLARVKGNGFELFGKIMANESE